MTVTVTTTVTVMIVIKVSCRFRVKVTVFVQGWQPRAIYHLLYGRNHDENESTTVASRLPVSSKVMTR